MSRVIRSMTFLSLMMMVVVIPACVRYNLEIRNRSDETLDIYIDGYYEGSVAPNNNLLIRNLSIGEHNIEAMDLHDRLVVEDEIYLDQDSEWVVY